MELLIEGSCLQSTASELGAYHRCSSWNFGGIFRIVDFIKTLAMQVAAIFSM